MHYLKKYFWLIVILVLAVLLRLYDYTAISLWHDEAFSALLIRYPWGEMFYRLGLDVHPPLYYILLRLWHYAFGDTVAALRGFSLLFGVLSVWAVWLLVKYAFKSEKTALWAAFLLAVNPFQLQYVTEARMYTMGAFFSVLAAYFLVRALREQKQYLEDLKLNMPNLPAERKLFGSYLWHYAWFALCSAGADLTHYYLLFTTAALGFYALVYHIYHYRAAYKKYAALLGSYALIILLFLPWLKQFLFQYRQVQAGYWIPPIDIWSIPGTLWTMVLGIAHDNGNPLTQKMLVVLTLFVLFVVWRFLRRTQQFEKWLVVLATLAPFLGAGLFVLLARLKGSSSSVYEERYFLFASSFLTVILAVWLAELRVRWLGAGLLIAYGLFNFYGFVHYWRDLGVEDKPGMAGAARFLGSNVELGDRVFVGTSYEFFNYKYYALTYYPLPAGAGPLLYTGGRADISQISHVEGVALLSNADLLPDFAAAVHPGDTVWLLWTYAFGSNKPDLPGNWTQIDERSYPDVRPYAGTTIYADEYKVN
ncbi:MAG TPA: glycosyltransferase family 39 protein [Patescibacteria group bacterium]|nr:glycosyltransferase family 39 protein [Patescibacteria group bacterium]